MFDIRYGTYPFSSELVLERTEKAIWGNESVLSLSLLLSS